MDNTNNGLDDDVTLPKATVQKLISEMVSKEITIAKETRDLMVDCCTEFIHLLASESNDVCEKELKKTISAEHNLGFDDYIKEVEQVLKDHKIQQKSRDRKSSRLEFSGLTQEELLKNQESLFEQARLKYQNINNIQKDKTSEE